MEKNTGTPIITWIFLTFSMLASIGTILHFIFDFHLILNGVITIALTIGINYVVYILENKSSLKKM